MNYLLHIAFLISLYVVLTVALDLTAGRVGRVSLAQAGFYGIGAYTSAIMTARWGASPLLALLAGVTLACLLARPVAYAARYVHGDVFVIVTFGFQVVLFGVFNNATWLTNGPLGIVAIPRFGIGPLQIDSSVKWCVASMATAALVIVFTSRLLSAPYGKVLKGIRDDEVLLASYGYDVSAWKGSVFSLSAGLSALAGSLYAHYVGFIDPTSFTVMESVLILSMLIVGGMGSLPGCIVGPAILILLPEVFRSLGASVTMAANLRQIALGVALVACIAFRPQGLLGRNVVS